MLGFEGFEPVFNVKDWTQIQNVIKIASGNKIFNIIGLIIILLVLFVPADWFENFDWILIITNEHNSLYRKCEFGENSNLNRFWRKHVFLFRDPIFLILEDILFTFIQDILQRVVHYLYACNDLLSFIVVSFQFHSWEEIYVNKF